MNQLIARLYKSRTFGHYDAQASFRAGLSSGEVSRIGQRLAAALQAPVYYQPGEPDDLCAFLYVLCLGREPALVELRAAPTSSPGAEPAAISLEAGAIRERYLRIACSAITRAVCVQEVALELDTQPAAAPAGMAVIRELPQPGVFDAKLLKRFQKTIDLVMAHDIEHLDMGLLDVPAQSFALQPGDYVQRFGVEPALLNFFFYAQPVLTATEAFVPLVPTTQAELAALAHTGASFAISL